MGRVDSLEKTLILRGIGGRRRRGDRGWDGWMASLIQWTWVWVNSGSWWWTGRLGAAIHWVAKSRTRLSDWTWMFMASILLKKRNRFFELWVFREGRHECQLGSHECILKEVKLGLCVKERAAFGPAMWSVYQVRGTPCTIAWSGTQAPGLFQNSFSRRARKPEEKVNENKRWGGLQN